MSFVFGADRRPWSRRHVSILVLAVAVIAPMSGFESAQAVEIEPGKQVAATFDYENEEGEKSTLHYLIYVPVDYAENDRKIPFMLFLHGAGERGDDLNRVKAWGPPRQLKEGKALPMIVVSPQCPKDTFWNVDQLAALVESLSKELRVDTQRRYVTGLSMGGFGTWGLLAKHAELFAAAAPICGGGDPTKAQSMKSVPIWVFHGDKDEVVPLTASQRMVDAVKEAGGNVKFTVFEGVGHNSWTPAYKESDLFEWLLEHSQKSDSPADKQ